MKRIVMFCATLLLASALCAPPLYAASEDTSVEGDTIAWVRGDVEQAFARARAENKPLFLYWGAVWCPPCVMIKKTVFQSRQFIALSELFVPYYLDGDTEEAQATGERFGVKGYPTMIVFNPAGEEITRIPGGIDIDRYNAVLERSLNAMRPTGQLLELAMKEPGELEEEDYTQLAYYSWGQDFDVLPEDTDPTLFKTLSEQAKQHDEVAAARLFLQYLVASVGENSEENPVRLEGAAERLIGILESDALVVAGWDTLAYWPEIVDILAIDEAAKNELAALWQERLMALRKDPSLSVEEQLAGWIPLLHFHFDGDEESEQPLPQALADELIRDVEAADQAVKSAYARQSLVNQIRWVYQNARMDDRARELLLAELERSKAPYYFMSSLGSLAERQGSNEEALEWFRKAYEGSEGSATRFQWGGSYVRALIRLAPEKDELILSTAEALFDELPSGDDVFSGRNFRVLKRLNDQLVAWKAEQGNTVDTRQFVARLETLCAAENEGSLEKQNCQSLLEDTTTT